MYSSRIAFAMSSAQVFMAADAGSFHRPVRIAYAAIAFAEAGHGWLSAL
jgi:hypothetical protein